MGARGGASRVTVWKCGTCGGLFERGDGGHKAAVRCCNELIAHAEATRKEAAARRSFSEVRKPTAHFEQDGPSQRIIAVATAKCPKCAEVRTVRVPLDGFYSGKRTKKDAAKKAVALAMAGIGKHIRTRWAHRR